MESAWLALPYCALTDDGGRHRDADRGIETPPYWAVVVTTTSRSVVRVTHLNVTLSLIRPTRYLDTAVARLLASPRLPRA